MLVAACLSYSYLAALVFCPSNEIKWKSKKKERRAFRRRRLKSALVHIGKMKIEHIVVHGSFDNSSYDGCVGVDKTFNHVQ